jgi:hypothetical protein
MNKLTVGLAVVIALLGGFYGGFRYESGKVGTTASAAASTSAGTAARAGGTAARTPGAGGGFAGAGGGFGAGRGSAGTITNLTAAGFTLHSANGTDTQVTFASGASVRKTVAGQLSDLQDNTTVAVTGTRDTSGNLVATAITLVPVPSPSPGG